MADLSSKQLQDFLDSQGEMLSDLFNRLETNQTKQNKSINDSIEKLSQVLSQKFDRLKDLADSNVNNNSNNNQDLSKLSASIDRLSTKTDALGKQKDDYQKSDGLGKIFDTVLEVVSVGTEAMKASYNAVNNQINFNRQMEVNGVISTFKELENAAQRSGVSLDQLSSVAGTFKNVVISLNASGMRGVEALAEMARNVQNTLQDQNISFTQEESLSLTGAVSEAMRRSGRLQELSQSQIEQQTVQMGKLLTAISEQTGASRSELMKGLAEGPSPILREGLRQQGWSKEQMDALNMVFEGLERQWGPELVNSWREFAATNGTITRNFVENNPFVFDQIAPALKQMMLMVQAGDQNAADVLNQRLTQIFPSAPDIPQVAALNDRLVAASSRNKGLSLSTSSMVGQRAGRATGDQEFAKERVETNELFKANAQAARDMNDAANNLRHLMMRMTHSVEMYRGISELVYGNLKKVGEGADELAGTLAEAISKLTGKQTFVKNGEISFMGSAEAAELGAGMTASTAAQQSEVIGKTIAQNISKAPQVSAQPEMSAVDRVGSGIDALDALLIAKSATAGTAAATSMLGAPLTTAMAVPDGVQETNKMISSFSNGNDREGYAHTAGMLNNIAGVALILGGLALSVGTAGAGTVGGGPMMAAGAAMLGLDFASEAITGDKLSTQAGRGVYDLTHSKNDITNKKISQQIRDDIYSIAPPINTADGGVLQQASAQDLSELVEYTKRSAEASEALNRKINNGANIY